MARILHINTALESAIVCLSDGDQLKGAFTHPRQRDHASFLHVAIKDLLSDSGILATDLDAIQVVEGPGSYTGLRVGMSCAKGLCFALSRPLITLNTLAWMAAGAAAHPPNMLRCPMIDARRMEVFTALFDAEGQSRLDATPMILSGDSFAPWLDQGPILFFGDGAPKFQEICQHPNAVFTDMTAGSAEMVAHGLKCYADNLFADLAYVEPFYGKAFHSTVVTS